MKKVLIIRHAKSSWKDALSLKDIDRPLKLRGVNDAIDMANRLKNKSIFPEKIISSNGIRALHTATIFSRELNIETKNIAIDSRLFHCDVSDIEMIIKEQNSTIQQIAIFCHNPSINQIASKYVNGFYENVPTSGILCFQAAIEKWEYFSVNNTKLEWFDYPKNKNR